MENTKSQKQQLCSRLRNVLIATHGLIQLVAEPEKELSQSESEKALKAAFTSAGRAVQIVEELYAVICSEAWEIPTTRRKSC
jgi:hypothetical protein